MTEREKIAHVLRRLGFGASEWELKSLVPLGYKNAVERILETPTKDIGHPLQFVMRESGENIDTGAWRLVRFWSLQMVCSSFPFREKLAVFWHDHFAVSAEEVNAGLLMTEYLQVLRANPAGKFRDLLKRTVKTTAFMNMLNVDMAIRDTPNENFARELLELYTLGEGNYTEKDIKEVARAFTGWSSRTIYWNMPGDERQRLASMARSGTPAGSFCFLEDVHDRGQKTILGQTKAWTGEEVLDFLAGHPQTIRHLCGKLWSFFGSKTPNPAVLGAMERAWTATDGSIRAVIRAMIEHSAFWADDVRGHLIKSPVDFVVGLARLMNSRAPLMAMVEHNAPIDRPVKQALFDQLGTINYFLEQTGQDLFWPPGVQGWEWHDAWINTALVLQRQRFGGLMTWEEYKVGEEKKWRPGPTTLYLVKELQLRKNDTCDAAIRNVCELLDTRLSESKVAALAQKMAKDGGLEILKHEGWTGGFVSGLIQAIRFSPEFNRI